jgi:hypothetical protein
LEELVNYQKGIEAWLDKIKRGHLKITDKDEVLWQEAYLKEKITSLDAAISPRLKFSLAPGAIFVPKEIFGPSSSAPTSDMDNVKLELAAQKLKQTELEVKFDQMAERQARLEAKFDRMDAKQDDMAADLKNLLTILASKP